MKVRIALGLDPDLLKRVDEARGDVPRQRFIQRALEATLSPSGQDSAGRQRGKDVLAHAEAALPALAKGKPRTCPRHPDAGKLKSRGKTYCAAPLCHIVLAD